jgi:hypothetical protein
VIRIFPYEGSAERLIGAWLGDSHGQWQASVKYFDRQEFWGLTITSQGGAVTAITPRGQITQTYSDDS